MEEKEESNYVVGSDAGLSRGENAGRVEEASLPDGAGGKNRGRAPGAAVDADHSRESGEIHQRRGAEKSGGAWPGL